MPTIKQLEKIWKTEFELFGYDPKIYGYPKNKIMDQQNKPTVLAVQKHIQGLIDFMKAEHKDFPENDLHDGYHSFNELYEFRKVYQALLFNEWSRQGLYDIHKSKRHYDGKECFGGGWFIVVAILPDGQISNHYKMEDWDLFKVPDSDKAYYPFDGHTPKDVLSRCKELI